MKMEHNVWQDIMDASNNGFPTPEEHIDASFAMFAHLQEDGAVVFLTDHNKIVATFTRQGHDVVYKPAILN